MIKDFHYLRPNTVGEALGLISQYKDDCKIICGGQSLLILMRQGLVATDYLVDIKRVQGLNYINFDMNEGLKMGDAQTHRAIEKSALITDKFTV